MKVSNSHHFGPGDRWSRKTILKWVLPWVITMALFVVIFSKMNIADVLALLPAVDIRYLLAGIFFSCSAHLLFSPARYRQIVSMMGRRMTFSEAVMIRMGCNPVKGILPFKVGELAIVAYMKKKYHLSYPGGVLSVFAGYPFSLLVLIIFYATGGLFYFPQGGQKIFFALLLMVALILASPFGIREMIFLLFDGIRKFKRISGVEENFFTEMHIDQEARKIIFYSLGVEGSKLLIIFCILKSLGVDVSGNVLLLLGSLTILFVYVPITYWGLGIRESAMIVLFSGHAVPEKLLAGGLMITFIDGILPVLLGLIFFKPFLDVMMNGNPES